MEDDILTKELWGIKGFYWSLPVNNNYTAEMSAINKAIRSVPPTVHVTIHTDSLSCIQAITRHRTYPLKTNLHKCNARPYLIATLRAIKQREALGGTTTLLHV
jgi:ribonuclease HI